MSLNIKNERVHRLARQAAAVTGKTQTGVIEEALEGLLADYGADPTAARAARKIEVAGTIAAEYAADIVDVEPVVCTVEDLFDSATGLPR